MAARFGARDVARLERIYAAPAIAAQRARTRAALETRPGERGLDVGCGPAFLAVELGREVGPGGRLLGIDQSPEMIEAARSRVAREGLADRVEIRQGEATDLPAPAGTFDFVTAVQVYLYVPAVERALGEARRVLRPGGRLVVVDTDWDSCVWLTSDRERHGRVMEARNAHFSQPHLPPRLPGLLGAAGFRVEHVEAIPVVELSGGAGSFSGDLIGAMGEGALRHGVDPDAVAGWQADLRARAAGGDYFFSVNRYLFRARRPEA
jgi:SAM-dependent methyltransferase